VAAPAPSRLDANQVLQGAYDEDNGRIRTDAEATIVNADIDVSINADEDSVASWTADGDGNPIDSNFGTPADALRTAAQIGNATGAASFGSGATNAQTLRTAANLQVNNDDVDTANSLPVSDLGLLSNVNYDDVQVTYPTSLIENYSYYLSAGLVATVEITYQDTAKKILLRARRI